MLAGLLLAGVGGGALALTRIWQQQAREPNEISELPLIQLEAPPIEIPGIVADGTIPPVTPAPETTAELTQDNALEVVRTWQTRKAEAMGQQYASNRLNEILVEPVLAEWQGSVEDLRQQQAYWQYTLDALEILAVTPIAADQADVRARVRETATFFQNGQAQADDSYNNDYVVQYRLVRQADQWRIREMEVVP
nr:ARC6/PARC6 family protein [Petrachloros mirabilis]